MKRISLSRPARIGLAAAIVMALLVAAGVAAFNGEGPNAERVVELLKEAGVTDTAELDEFADEFGLGGAVRILWWAEAAGVEDPSEIAAMRREGMGWGQIRRALAEDEDFDLNPGIGPVMGGHGQGHGQGQAQGQAKDKGNAPGD